MQYSTRGRWVVLVLSLLTAGCGSLFRTPWDDLDFSPVDTAPGYVKRTKAVIQKTWDKHLPVYIESDHGWVRVDAKALDTLDLSPVERYARAPADERWGKPELDTGFILLLTNVSRVEKVIQTAKEKHLAVVLDGKVVDPTALAALNPSKIAHAAIYETGDGMAVDTYGPEVKDGFLFLTTRTHQ